MQHPISKSKFLAGMQCSKLLWTHYNAGERIPAVDAGTQAICDQGHAVGRLAQRLVPGGSEIRCGAMTSMIEGTRSAVATRPKDVNLHDLAVQTVCVQAAGPRIDRVHLVLVDNEYVRRGAPDPWALFHRFDRTDQVRARIRMIGTEVAAMQAVIAGPESDVPIGPHCEDPYACPLKERCWSFLPEHAVTTLHRAGRNAFEWRGRGIVDLRDVDGTRPYQPIAFQASAHVLETPASAPVHLEVLHLEPTDPRPALVEFLLGLPTTGSVVAWHASYESRILEGLSAAFESSTVELDAVRGLVDLEDPFPEFVAHRPPRFGSTSIKNVLLALSSLSYDDEAIGSGDVAAARYLRVVHGWPEAAQIDAFAREELAADLRRY